MACILCNEHKVSHMGDPKLGEPPRPAALNQEFQIDLVEGLFRKEGTQTFMTCVEKFSGYIVPMVLKSKDSPYIADQFEREVITKFAPIRVSSDNARNLISKVMVTKLNWYCIKLCPTTRYAPITHGLVEIKNRHLQTVVRILSDQFQVPWTKCVHLAAMLLNTTNAPYLNHKSSYEIMFGTPPAWKDITPEKLTSEEVLDPDEYHKELLRSRKQAWKAVQNHFSRRRRLNAKKKGKVISMKPGTLVYVKDYRISPHKKAHARFLRAPSMVVREYPTVVFHRTLSGVILRDHKRNLKICPPRDFETFQKLPTKIKTILGGVFDEKTFTKYADKYSDNHLPEFLKENDTPTKSIASRTRQKNDTDDVDWDDLPLEHPREIFEPQNDTTPDKITNQTNDSTNDNDIQLADTQPMTGPIQTDNLPTSDESPIAKRTRTQSKHVTFNLLPETGKSNI